MRQEKGVLLGMSGGTDSSVSAMLLQEEGYEVTGITFRFWDSPQAEIHLDDAATLARRLGITHYIYDAREEFARQVVDNFTAEYLRGRTPVPCVRCNNGLKWPLLLQEADRLNLERIATGHYVRLGHYGESRCVMKGADADKDQSFFLWGLSQTVLSRALFPLGGKTKNDVRDEALRRGFERVATKHDSVGVCFCPGDYRTFLLSRSGCGVVAPGDFLDEEGNRMGTHRGYPFYTVGQRRGLGVQRRYPLFVKSIHPDRNTVVLAPLSSLYKESFTLCEVNSINSSIFTEPKPLICRIRYRKQATPCRVWTMENRRARVELLEPLESIAPGQSAVFYRDDCVVGGGIIEE